LPPDGTPRISASALHRRANLRLFTVELPEPIRDVLTAFVPASARPRHASPETTLVLRAELAEQRLADLKLALEDMKAQRDKWQQQAERLALADATAKRSWCKRLAG
jgi:hypothetical protein